MTSPRRAARRHALTSIIFMLLTISRLCLSCHTGWNLVLKGHNSPRSVSHGGSFQSHPPLRTGFRGRSRTKHWKRQRGTDAPQQPRIVLLRSNRAVRTRTKNTSNRFIMRRFNVSVVVVAAQKKKVKGAQNHVSVGPGQPVH